MNIILLGIAKKLAKNVEEKIPKVKKVTVTIPASTSAGVYNCGKLEDITDNEIKKQDEMLSLLTYVEDGNTNKLGETIQYLLYGDKLYIKIASSLNASETIKIGCVFTY